VRLSEKTKQKALAHAKKEFPKESVGIVCLVKDQEKYFPCRNEAEKPEYHFSLSPFDYLKCVKKGDIKAIIHSHPNSAPIPSAHDIKVCERGNTTWFIVNPVTEEWGCYKPFKCKD